ncbi:MAG: hypothetical protein JSU04_08640 [Bdellovibrionales bacterium]|nr:hypothetical protein [Bdellovibrionales bacterium]
MADILIVYRTKNGQTEKIANDIANHFQRMGHWTDLYNSEQSVLISKGEYDAIIVGGPVYLGSFPRTLRRWVRRNHEALKSVPTAFFSVCLGVLQKDPKVQAEERKIVQDFFATTKWVPQQWTIFPGALLYSQYNWLTKIIMKRIARKAGAPTDFSKDYEYTNWQEVRHFSETFGQRLETKSHSPHLN